MLRPLVPDRVSFGTCAAGEPAGLRSAADGKTFRRPAIEPGRERAAPAATAAIPPAGGAGGFQAAVRTPPRLDLRRRRDTAGSACGDLSSLHREKGIAGRSRGDRR